MIWTHCRDDGEGSMRVGWNPTSTSEPRLNRICQARNSLSGFASIPREITGSLPNRHLEPCNVAGPYQAFQSITTSPLQSFWRPVWRLQRQFGLGADGIADDHGDHSHICNRARITDAEGRRCFFLNHRCVRRFEAGGSHKLGQKPIFLTGPCCQRGCGEIISTRVGFFVSSARRLTATQQKDSIGSREKWTGRTQSKCFAMC